MEQLIEKILVDYSYVVLFMLSFGYFIILYFGVGFLFLSTCKFLERRNILTKIENVKITKEQINYEIKHSLKSIVVFGFSIIPILYLIRVDVIKLLPNT